MRPGSAIFVLGVAGVGKTTFGRHLAAALGLKFIDIPELIERRRLYLEYDRRSGSYIIDLRALSAAVGSELRGRGGVVASIYAFKPRRIEVSHAILLRMRPTRLLEALRSRGYPDDKIRENVMAELLDQPLVEAIQRFGEEKVVQLDATGADLRDLARGVAEAIRAGRLKDMDRKIDWMAELEGSGELDGLLRFLESGGLR